MTDTVDPKPPKRANRRKSLPVPPDAAFMFVPDAYAVSRADIKGRHVVGDGFLRAAVERNEGRALTGYVRSASVAAQFQQVVQSMRSKLRTETVLYGDTAGLKRAQTLYLPGPGLGDHAYVRLRADPAAYSLVGITHTLASETATRAIAQLLDSPVMPWDALVCTSSTARAAVERLLERQSEYLSWRFQGATLPRWPELPVIPLGIHPSDFAATADERAAARDRLGASGDSIVLLFLGRLSFHAKAHPHAMMAAAQRLSEATGRSIILHLCGNFTNDHIRQAFVDGAKVFCPNVKTVFTEGADGNARRLAYAAADIFISLSDNHQETFGITVLEGMAAGLPVVVSDWDGYRDTVSHGIEGFRIPTSAPGPDVDTALAQRFEANQLSYDEYIGAASMMVSVDHQCLFERLQDLATNTDLRRTMGEAGRRRVASHYDWAVVYKQYRDLYRALGERRAAANGASAVVHAAPDTSATPVERPLCRPSTTEPFRLFAEYPTGMINADTVVERGVMGADWETTLQHVLFSNTTMGPDPALCSKFIATLGEDSQSIGDIAAAAGEDADEMVQVAASLLKTGGIALSEGARLERGVSPPPDDGDGLRTPDRQSLRMRAPSLDADDAGYFTHYLTQTDERELHKFAHYMEIYDEIMTEWQSCNVNFLEIGVFRGGSIPMWRNFFSSAAQLTFIDVDPKCKKLEIEGTEVVIGDQANRAFLADLCFRKGPFDIVIDDGGHHAHQQRTSFETLWPHLRDGGVYIVEDVHTSYWPGFGGGLRKPQSFIEYIKSLIDIMHCWYSEERNFAFDRRVHELGSITFYDSIIVIRKQNKVTWPVAIVAKNGKVSQNRAYAKLKNKKSIFD